MTDEIVQDEVVDEVVDVVEGAPAELSEVEQKAVKMGWTPKEEFKGDPAKWRSAEEFVDRGENMLPIVKARVTQQAKEIEELKAAMKQFGEYHTKTEQRAYEKAMADLRQQRADAIAAADGVKFDEVDSQIEQMRRQIEDKAKIAEVKPRAEEDPVYKEWEADNKWVKDPELEQYAYDIGLKLKESGIRATGRDFLELVGKKVKTLFPEKFENPRRAAAASVEGGVPAPRKGGKSYADLPADARSACDRMAKNAYSGDEKATAQFKAEYVKNYFEGA